MFVSAEMYANIINKKPEGQVVPSLVSKESLWVLVWEVFALSEPLMKVSQLVDSDMPIIAYLYEAMDRITKNLPKHFMRDQVRRVSSSSSWDFIDDRWNNMLHHPLHTTRAFLNPTLFYSGDFDYYSEAMVRFFSCVQRIVPYPRAHVAIPVLEMYK